MRRTLTAIGVTLLTSMSSLPLAAPALGVGSVATVPATIDTSAWLPPSPDPSGIAWWADKNELIVVDGEVEEMAIYAGANTWEIATDGSVIRTSTTSMPPPPTPNFSNEPIDVAAAGSTIYMSDDSQDRVFVIDVGPDGQLGTGDDARSSVSTAAFGSYDPEGLDLGNGDLFVSDGINNQVYRVDAGANGLFDGLDDRVTCFDTSALGMRDPEGITKDQTTGVLYYASRNDDQIAASTASGQLLDLIDITGVNAVAPSGITVAPASDGSVASHLYVTDRGVDNDVDPNENDGRIHEIALSAPIVDEQPVVASPGRQKVVEGESVQLQIVATDPNDDALTFTAQASGPLPPGLSIDPVTGLITGTVQAGAAGPGGATTYESSIRMTDGTAPHTFLTLFWDVTNGPIVNQAPVVTNPGDQAGSVGDAVSLPVGAADPDASGALMHSATGLPPGLWMDCATGQISGTIAPGAAAGSPYTVRVHVSDQRAPGVDGFPSKWDAETFTWTIGDPPSDGIEFRGASSAAVSSARSLSLVGPDGVQDGDLLLAAIGFVGSPHSVEAPDGWALLRRDRVPLGLQSQQVFWKVAGANEPASYGWRSSSWFGASAVIVAYGGVDEGAPFVSHDGDGHLLPTRWIKAPSVTATAAGELLVGFFGMTANASIEPPASMLERAERTSPGLIRITLEAADEALLAAGPTGIRRAASSRLGINIGQVVVLRPAP